MKPTFEISDRLFENTAPFEDSFFKRFELRHAPRPLQLTEKIAKNYLFPTFYSNVSCAIGIFFCDYERAKALMPHPKVVPVSMLRGRALVTFSCYQYRNVMNVAPYNEIAMTIPVMSDPAVNVPVLPMVAPIFKSFGYYVFSMPVTSKENELRGRKIWGLPKVTQEIDIREENGEALTVARDEHGEPYFELRVPMNGQPKSFDVRANLYSRLEERLLKSQTCFKASFNVTKSPETGREYLKLGRGSSAAILRALKIDPKPFQFRYTGTMNSAFDLPQAADLQNI
jgi:hypothetical protein